MTIDNLKNKLLKIKKMKKLNIMGKDTNPLQIFSLLFIIIVPIPLAGYILRKFFDKDFSYLGPFGDYVAGTTVPVLTAISFIALIINIRQQKDQIDLQKVQLDIQKEEIEENRKVKKLEDLREVIINVDEALDIINPICSLLFELIDQSKHGNLELFYLNNNYKLLKNDIIANVLDHEMKTIRKTLINTNVDIYDIFLTFHNDVESKYNTHIRPIEQGFMAFERKMRQKYPLAILYKELEPNFSEISFNVTDIDELNLQKVTLHVNEIRFIKEIDQSYNTLKYELDKSMLDLLRELKKMRT